MARIPNMFFLLFLGIAFLLFPVWPGSLAVRHVEAASVTLAWDPNTEPDIAGYKLYYGTTEGSYEFAIDVGNQTMYSISGFLEGVDYYFAVTAYDNIGLESTFSDEVSYLGQIAVRIPLSGGWNLISLPIEPLNPDVTALTGQLSPCLLQLFWYSNDNWEFYDPAQIDTNTLTMMVPGKAYWVEMACPGEMMVAGTRTTNSVPLTVGENLVGYSSLTPLPVSEALSSIANKYFRIWTQKEDVFMFYDPRFEAESTLKAMTPGSGYYIEALEETIWTLPYDIGY